MIWRDDWGIPHVYGKTDVDTVYGVVYAQAEDDFSRVEMNYINALGRLAETEGERAIFRDLRMKLFIDPEDMKAKYAASPDWLKKLMNAHADALNDYLQSHPSVNPRVIKHFEPSMPLAFTDGSIGGDIERVSVPDLEAFYTKRAAASMKQEKELTGSNGIAIAPANTRDHHALLLINPHTSFYFRAEAQMTSEEGLRAYGAITWGQFFIYQGFNDRVGWMHTSSSVDNIDEYAETIVKKGERLYYKYGREERPVTVQKISVPYKKDDGVAVREFTIYRTHHGPIVRKVGEKWISVRLMQEPIKALTQSFLRTKAKGYKEFRDTMELHTNSSNNTVYADADGTIAYFHANFIPRRDRSFDWTKPVDGSNPKTEWGDVLSIDESPNAINPKTGWVFNTNNAPWTAAGPDSPRQADYAAYVDGGTENPRGEHATLMLKDKHDFTLESLRASAYDSFLPLFATEIPRLIQDWESLPKSSRLKSRLSKAIHLLQTWDFRWLAQSVPTAIAVSWAEERAKMAKTSRLDALKAAVDRLQKDYGSVNIPWGKMNRYQRVNDDITPGFDDAQASSPVPFVSGRWGSLAAYEIHRDEKSKKNFGVAGNSFVAVVEFGEKVRAKAITIGGQSGHPKSPHFTDQFQRYADGDLRDVYFYKEDVERHLSDRYHPGER